MSILSRISSLESRRGLTMIELMVAVGIFLILITAATGGFVRALLTQRAIVALMTANDNASLVLEQMAREIRVGYNFRTNASENELTFVNAYNEIVTYRLNNQAIERGVGGLGSTTFKRLTAEIARINDMKFRLQGAESGDREPPRVTINLAVGARGKSVENIVVNIQTTVSARLIDS